MVNKHSCLQNVPFEDVIYFLYTIHLNFFVHSARNTFIRFILIFILVKFTSVGVVFRSCSAKESRLGPGTSPKIGHSEGANTPHQNERWYPKTKHE